MDPIPLREWIAALADPDLAKRQQAAQQLYRFGTNRVAPVLAAWRSDEVLARYLGEALTVGVAVRPDTFERIRHACGEPPLTAVPAEQEVAEFELDFPEAVHLDILTSTHPDGDTPLARFLKRHGEAIQQVEVPVTDVEAVTARLRERFGLSPSFPQARAGANGTRVNFFLVQIGPNERVLVELVEAPAIG